MTSGAPTLEIGSGKFVSPASSGRGDQIPIASQVRLDVWPIGILVHDDCVLARTPAVRQQNAVLTEPVIVSAIVQEDDWIALIDKGQ